MKRLLIVAAASLLTVQANALTRPHTHKRKAVVRAAVPAMSPERATQIQAALIKAGYLSGEPSGTWDAASNAAMQKYQSDNGWQTKLTPDSRALHKLGLGAQSEAAN